MIRFLERNGYDVSYTTGIDTARRGAELLEHKVFLSVGHDEYWAGQQRTNVEAARRSIESFPRGVVAIVGGRFKGGDLTRLREPLAASGTAVIAIGEATPLLHQALDGVVPVIDAGSMREAVERGYEAAGEGGVVLLAPACASFDWFRDYAERGNTFKEEVTRLKRRME